MSLWSRKSSGGKKPQAGYKLSLDNTKAIFGKRLDALMKAARGGAQGS